jgi:hypothetical protein
MMIPTCLGLLVAVLSVRFACVSASPLLKSRPTVYLGGSDQVRFEGTSANNVESFLNIRFGEDTSGKNRFAAPKPYAYPPGSVVNASQPGAACPQQKVPIAGLAVFDNVTHISEDCLTLRVDRPAKTSPKDKLPVMVYIYGGGDSIGQIYDSAYDPAALITGASQKGYPIIYVAMNYRVGIFGFATTPALNQSNSLNALWSGCSGILRPFVVILIMSLFLEKAMALLVSVCRSLHLEERKRHRFSERLCNLVMQLLMRAPQAI